MEQTARWHPLDNVLRGLRGASAEYLALATNDDGLSLSMAWWMRRRSTRSGLRADGPALGSRHRT
jgi:hypothetical protein